MDPLTIATVAGHCFQVAKASWDVGALLYTFIKEARVVNETVSGLANEVNQLGNVLDLVEDVLKTLQGDLEMQPRPARNPHQSILRSIKLLEGQVNGCERTVEALRAATKDLKDKNGHFIAKAVTQFRVNMTKDNVIEISRRISSHYHALNCCLTILNTQVIFILPQRIDADVKYNVDELREQEQTLDSRKRLGPLTGPESELLQLTRTTIDDGESLYEQSVASGSVVGGDLNSENSILSWLGKMDLLSSEEATDGALLPGKSNSPLQPTRATIPLSDHEDTMNGVSDLSSTSLNEPNTSLDNDPGVELAYAVASRAMAAAKEAFDAFHYRIAKINISETLAMIKNLESNLHADFDLFKAHYVLVVSSWYTEERASSKPKMVEFLRRHPSNDAQRLDMCTVSNLLARTYVELGELEHARHTCESGLKARKVLLGAESDEYGDSLALMSRIHSLLGNPAQSEALASMIPAAKARDFTKRCARLAPRSSNFDRRVLSKLRPSMTDKRTAFGRKKFLWAVLSPISDALRTGDIQLGIELIRAANSETIENGTKRDGFSPLHLAAVLGSVEAATILLDRGSDPHVLATAHSKITYLAHTTPLQCGIEGMNYDLVRLLTRHCGIITRGTWPFCNLLKKAADGGATDRLDMVHCLLDVGYDINTRTDHDKNTLLHDVYHDMCHEGVGRYLPSEYASSQYGLSEKQKLQWMRIASDYLIANGADVLLQNTAAKIPLMLCLESELCSPMHVEVLLRVQPKAQLASRDLNGRTPLHYALKSGPRLEWSQGILPTSQREMDPVLEVAAILLRAGASISAKDINQRTPLHTCWYNDGDPSPGSPYLNKVKYSSKLYERLNQLARIHPPRTSTNTA